MLRTVKIVKVAHGNDKKPFLYQAQNTVIMTDWATGDTPEEAKKAYVDKHVDVFRREFEAGTKFVTEES